MRCATCGAKSEAGKRFCNECGAALPGAVAEQATLGSRGVSQAVSSTKRVQGERRHLTILLSDLVNSTRLAAARDPEEWRDVATEYLRAATVRDLNGYVARYQGDGVLAHFGWPSADEDDAERAVRAGLAIVEAIAALNRRIAGKTGVELSVRVGIDSGLVIVDDAGSGTAEVFGDAPNIAARVQAKCTPNSVLMTGAVQILSLVGLRLRIGAPSCSQVSSARSGSTELPRRAVSVGNGDAVWFAGRRASLTARASSRSCGKLAQRPRGPGAMGVYHGRPRTGQVTPGREFRSQIKEAHRWIGCTGERFFESTPFARCRQVA